MTNAKYVAYYRVSTDRQGQSGLGLDAQRKAVMDHLNGGTMLDSFTEVESGRRNDRPELAKALDLCRRKKATLVIAKLDRLALYHARNVVLIALLGLTGCGLAPPKVIGGNENEVAVQTASMAIGNPGEVALQHCSKYGKRAVLRNVQKLDFDTRRAVYYYDCR